MAAHLPRLIASPIDEVDYQETSFSVDAVARNVCNTWEEATTNPDFDVVVIGSGMFGAYCADKLFRDTKIEAHAPAGGRRFPVAEHFQNLPNIGLNVPDPMDPANDNGLPREIVWGMPWRGNTSFVGTPYCVGGKSVYWGGWCPRLTDGGFSRLATERRAIFEKQLSVGRRAARSVGNPTDFIQGSLYEAMLAKAKGAS